MDYEYDEIELSLANEFELAPMTETDFNLLVTDNDFLELAA